MIYLYQSVNMFDFCNSYNYRNYFSGLKHGEITSQHLLQQLQNPAMQHRHREVLASILKLQLQPGKM